MCFQTNMYAQYVESSASHRCLVLVVLSPYEGRHIAHRGSYLYLDDEKLQNLIWHRCSFCVILVTTSMTKHCAPRFTFYRFQRILASHRGSFRSFYHHIEFARLRTEVYFCSFLVHLSFAPRFIFGNSVTISNSKHCASRFIFVH